MIRRPPRSTRTDTLFPYTTLFRSDVLIWAASQIVEAENLGLRTSRFLRFTPYQLLMATGRETGARDYRLFKGALSRLQSTSIRTTIRHGEHWRRHQFSWINEWEELNRARSEERSLGKEWVSTRRSRWSAD